MSSNIDRKLRVWQDFCERHHVVGRSVPLFDATGCDVTVHEYGLDARPLLQRSRSMDDLVIAETTKVLDDFDASTTEYEGLIYMMFWQDDGLVLPLYIGKSEKYGRGGGNLSANIRDIDRNQGFFARWGYNYAYHIGDLSAAILPGHPISKVKEKYVRWANRLFATRPTLSPKLRRDTRFWTEAWQHGDIGIWQEYGATSLTFLEYLLIGVASDLFPEYLLNDEGVNRG